MKTAPLWEVCRRYVREATAVVGPKGPLVEAVWAIGYALGWRYAFGRNPVDRPVDRQFILIEAGGGFGASHSPGGPLSLLSNCIGKSVLDLASFPLSYQIAALDAAAASFVPEPDEQIVLEGSTTEKTDARTEVLCREAVRLAFQSERLVPRVVVVGALERVITRLATGHGIVVTSADADPAVIGRSYSGVVVQNQRCTERLLRESDVAIVTGMTLATETVDVIINTAREKGIRLLFYLQTGANLVVPYLSVGAACVISEPYPFYFMGPRFSLVRVYRSPQLR